MRNGDRLDGASDSLGNPNAFAEIHVAEHHHQLFAAEAGRYVLRSPQLGRDDGAHALQAGVAGQMPVAVVECLELVDVEHQQRDILVMRLRARPERLERIVEVPAIAEAGQRIAAGDLFQFVVTLAIAQAQEEIAAGAAFERVGGHEREQNDARQHHDRHQSAIRGETVHLLDRHHVDGKRGQRRGHGIPEADALNDVGKQDDEDDPVAVVDAERAAAGKHQPQDACGDDDGDRGLHRLAQRRRRIGPQNDHHHQSERRHHAEPHQDRIVEDVRDEAQVDQQKQIVKGEDSHPEDDQMATARQTGFRLEHALQPVRELELPPRALERNVDFVR